MKFCPLSKKRKISPKKREKKEVFSYLPHGLCRTPRYTEEHCFLVFVLVDPPCWAVVPPPPSKEEGSSLAFCFKKKTKTKTKKKWGSLDRRKLIRKSAGKKRLFQKGNNNKKKLKKKTSRVAVINARTKQRSASKTLRSARKLCKYLVFVHPLINARSKSLSLSLFAFRI